MKIDPDDVLRKLELWWMPGDANKLKRDIYFSIKDFLEVRLPESQHSIEEYCCFLSLRVFMGFFPPEEIKREEAARIYSMLLRKAN